MCNNPTIDTLTEIQEFNAGLKATVLIYSIGSLIVIWHQPKDFRLGKAIN